MGKGVTFVPAGDNTRVETAVQELDGDTVVVTEKGFNTDDPGVIAALDLVPTLTRKTARSRSAAKAAGAPPPPPPDQEQPKAEGAS